MTTAEFIQFVEETLEVDSGTISLTDVLDEIEWDSLANISFIAEIDTRFGVSLDSEKLAKSETVSDLFGLLTGAISSK